MKKTIITIAVVFFMLTNFFSISISGENINDEIVVSYCFDNLQMEKITLEFPNEQSRDSFINPLPKSE